MRIVVVGCGLIGNRRARVAAESGDTVVGVCDLDERAARATGDAVGASWTTNFPELVARSDVDAVVVSTVNAALLPVATAALDAGKHVLCEKPLGRNAGEAAAILGAARRADRVLKTGFNHRHHPAIARAHELVGSGAVGELFSARIAYGHGGRPGYEREWRGDPELAGGGELLDQGVHAIDLCRWFLGAVVEVSGMVGTWGWGVTPLEDNAFALLRMRDGGVASVHTSWTQWRNLFRFELFGRDGFITVEGLGGSYGVERLTVGRRRPESGPPDEETTTYDGPDVSWALEWREFRAAIEEGREPLGSGEDGYRAACVIDALYEAARTGAVVPVACEAVPS